MAKEYKKVVSRTIFSADAICWCAVSNSRGRHSRTAIMNPRSLGRDYWFSCLIVLQWKKVSEKWRSQLWPEEEGHWWQERCKRKKFAFNDLSDDDVVLDLDSTHAVAEVSLVPAVHLVNDRTQVVLCVFFYFFFILIIPHSSWWHWSEARENSDGAIQLISSCTRRSSCLSRTPFEVVWNFTFVG